MALAENIVDFLADFGVACTIGGVAQVGIFDKTYIEEYGIVAGNKPVLLIADSALGSGVKGSSVVVVGVNYVIACIEPDGTGMTLLRLEKQ